MKNNNKNMKVGTLILIMIFTFLLMSIILLSSVRQYRSHHLSQLFGNFSVDGFMYAMENENRYFANSYFNDNQRRSIPNIIFSLITNVNFQDPRSFIRNEIPGYANYYSHIIIAGVGTNLTNLPRESYLEIESLQDEFNNEQEQKDSNEEIISNENETPSISNNNRQSVFIYHSHCRESFFPLLPGVDSSNPNLAFSAEPEANISILGERLLERLEERGIGVIHDTTSIAQMLFDNNLGYGNSYKMSRQIIEEAMDENDDIIFLIDLHRDSQRWDLTTKTINGEDYARLYFVVGMEHPDWEDNLAIANALNDELESRLPGISRGIFPKYSDSGNGIYNQDLSPKALLLEVGGVDNNLDELNRTIDVFADVFASYYFNHMEVNN